MLDKLEFIERRYEELSKAIADPEVIAKQNEWKKLVKEHAELEDIVVKYREYKTIEQDMAVAREMLKEKLDEESLTMLRDELDALEDRREKVLQDLRLLLLPKDPNDEKNVVMEIRAGAGGEEAALFGADLFRMYSRYAERKGWRIEVMSANYTDMGGVKELIFVVEGEGAYSRLKYESGVHRVQRIPTTESGGRIHTSTATVAVLPEAEDVEVEINPDDLRIEVFRSSGHGGQSVNTTDSAVRITHIPTGIVVTCQDERSRVLDAIQREREQEYAQARKSQVGTGDRSERIRTYNFPQGRITDHRIGKTIYNLEGFLDGDMDEIINELIINDQAERLKNTQASQ